MQSRLDYPDLQVAENNQNYWQDIIKSAERKW